MSYAWGPVEESSINKLVRKKSYYFRDAFLKNIQFLHVLRFKM